MQVRSDRNKAAKRASGSVLSVFKANGVSQHAYRIAYVLALIGTVFIGMALAQKVKAGVRWPKTEQQVMLSEPLQQLIEVAQLIEAENAESKASQTK